MINRRIPWILPILMTAVLQPASAADGRLPEVIERIEPAIVAIGSYAPLEQPPSQFRGTGFVVRDGHLVITNHHVLPQDLDPESKARLAVFVGRGNRVQPRRAERVAVDPEHDLAVLRVEGEPLPTLELGRSQDVRAGQRFAFTGFPIAMVLGMYPVTHEGIVSAVTPIAVPRGRASALDSRSIARLDEPYPVFQLDANAYPGNSGSPLYRQDDGRVVGIVNMVFVKQSKEAILREPSGIGYAIPIEHAVRLLKQAEQ